MLIIFTDIYANKTYAYFYIYHLNAYRIKIDYAISIFFFI